MMIELIRCEWLKFKRTPLLLYVFAGAVVFPLMNAWNWIRDGVRHDSWDALLKTIDFQMFTFSGVLIFSIIAASLYAKEFTDKTMNTLLTYPASRRQVYIGKFLFLCIVAALVYVFKTATTLAVGVWFVNEPLTMGRVLTQLKADGSSYLFQVAILPMYTFLISVFKNATVPIVFAVIGAFGNIFVLNAPFPMQYYPFFCPLLPLNMVPYDPFYAFMTAFLVLAAGLYANLLYYSRADFHQ
ncbi:ABC transporter permease [Paenibacillus sp. MSJ-34]|uniref:ABC transporter permease n=1 Tax=Paenibacillus sp. MSJ-34 TaxID=2841529 RepID=UPI001C10D7FB|nr:ABC transporter permease [Paenibacillus sp. MSJ-34]MBU5442030.1 ABC transporter permease [Paenibacillus sp. MSJ-34]